MWACCLRLWKPVSSFHVARLFAGSTIGLARLDTVHRDSKRASCPNSRANVAVRAASSTCDKLRIGIGVVTGCSLRVVATVL